MKTRDILIAGTLLWIVIMYLLVSISARAQGTSTGGGFRPYHISIPLTSYDGRICVIDDAFTHECVRYQ